MQNNNTKQIILLNQNTSITKTRSNSYWNFKTWSFLALAAASGYYLYKNNWIPFFNNSKNESDNGSENSTIRDLKFYQRTWIDSTSEPISFEHLIEEYSLLSYNILAQMYVNLENIEYLSKETNFPKILDWSNRKELILQELQFYATDFVNLQEVQNNHWENLLSSLNNRIASQNIFYKAIFAEKPTNLNMFEVKMREKDSRALKYKNMGIALLYNSLKWTCLDHQIINLGSIHDDSLIDLYSYNSMLEQYPELGYMKRENSHSVIIAQLQHKMNKKQLILVNTHLQWNPQYSPLKLFQHLLLTKHVELFLKKRNLWNQETNSPSIAVIISGDFNSLPDSAAYEFMTQGTLNFNSQNMEILNQKDFATVMRFINFSSNSLHSLQSAYEQRGNPISNFTPKFEGCLDYIYHTQLIQVTKLLEEISKSSSMMQEQKFLPNLFCASDHAALGMKFLLK